MMVNVSGLPTLTNGMDSVPMAIYVVRHMVCRSAALADPGSFRIKPGCSSKKEEGYQYITWFHDHSNLRGVIGARGGMVKKIIRVSCRVVKFWKQRNKVCKHVSSTKYLRLINYPRTAAFARSNDFF